MLLILNMKRKRDIFSYRLSWSSTICEKYATGAVQMEGAILVVAVNDGLKFRRVNISF